MITIDNKPIKLQIWDTVRLPFFLSALLTESKLDTQSLANPEALVPRPLKAVPDTAN
ncbi:hypothetical protein C2845_PM07G12640 [Panicum miliaceum]|uniref:Uncharacterized protein n=1 Tax=Panicum miliaceum TaxID=4540 RepID=A0A3L6SIY9_PANMI|nr:hypothetical protein C2845_PM07G12640 [Panicum miliaceum]